MAARSMIAVLLLALASALATAPFAGAQATQVCGQPPQAGEPPVRGTLTLEQGSKTAVAYGRDTDEETLNLVFRVVGCRLPDDAPDPMVEVRPKGSPELPRAEGAVGAAAPTDVITLRDATPDGEMLEVRLDIAAEAIKPDAYEAYVVLRAPYIASSRTPVAVSRSEESWWVPAGVGAVCGLLGFLWLCVTKLVSREELTLSWGWLVPFGVVAAAFGAAAVLSSWWDQEVWSFAENGKAAVGVGIAGATTGSMLTLIGAIWKAKTPVGGGGGGA